MGVEASKPKPGAKFEVIGADLARTGTASLSASLSILLDGPVYHGGTQICKANTEWHIETWVHILSHTPFKSAKYKDYIKTKMESVFDGYVACADTPMAQFVPELMEIYPDAKVVCTVRDADAWAKSMDQMANAWLQGMISVILYWVPVMWLFPRYYTHLQAGRWGELYAKPGEEWTHGRGMSSFHVWERHMEYLERSVPRDKLLYFDVRDGWEPLCKALDLPVPDVPFPKVNDGKALDEFAKQCVNRGLMRWGVVMGAATVVAGAAA